METARERILTFVMDYITKHGYSPTTREIGEGTGLKSVATVNYHLHVMFHSGVLETDAEPGAPRAIRVPGMIFIKRGGKTK